MKNIVLFSLIALFVVTACRKEEPDVIYPYNPDYYNTGNIDQIPQGGTGIVSNSDLSGLGNQTVVHGTSLIISGNVTMDALTITGEAFLQEGATLTINGTTTVVGGANFDVDGTLITNVLVQTGDTYLNHGDITVLGKYQIVGGSTLFIQNSVVHVDELEIIGSIQNPENEYTNSTNVYSVIESIDAKLLWINAGAVICGPVILTTDEDNNSTQNTTLVDVTSSALVNQPDIKTIYHLQDASTSFYQFNSSCTPLTSFPTH
jgi:hypothetical protein